MSRSWGIGIPVSSFANEITGSVLVMSKPSIEHKRPRLPRRPPPWGARRRRHARPPALRLEGFDQLGQVKHGHVADRVEDLVLAQTGLRRHCGLSYRVKKQRPRRAEP